jgi:hypothetical protein
MVRYIAVATPVTSTKIKSGNFKQSCLIFFNCSFRDYIGY